MIRWLRWLFPRTKARAMMNRAAIDDLDVREREQHERLRRDAEEKQEMAQRIHDAAARLHVLEWKADVQSRQKQSKGSP